MRSISVAFTRRVWFSVLLSFCFHWVTSFVANTNDFSSHNLKGPVHVSLMAENIPTTEMSALNDLFVSTKGYQWQWETENTTASGIPWNFTATANPCADHWQGLTCAVDESNTYHISSIELKDYGLDGPLPDSIGNLQYLLKFNLSQNNLNGTLPDTLGSIAGLEVLALSDCHLNGTFPEVVTQLTNLTTLDLSVNTFRGTLPSSLGNLQRLQLLDVIDNLITGSINSVITQMRSLQAIALSGNFLTGTIPESINQLTQLRFLLLSFNRLNGTLSSSLLNTSSLELLQINVNSFSGPLPSEISNLRNLIALDLSANFFSGTIPAELSNLSKLRFMYLNRNRLIGKIPSSLGNLVRLQNLVIDSNRLSGQIPSSLGLLPKLTEITMFNNSLTGPIPQTFTELRTLRGLVLSQNYLNGTLPDAFSGLSDLETLFLDFNAITGTLPASWSALSQLKNFQASYNQLRGSVPASYQDLANLEQFRLNYNQLTGTVPLVLLSLPRLQRLALKGNKLVGSLPAALANASGLVEFAVSDNRLTGSIPDLFDRLRALQYLELDGNALTGTLPLSLAGLGNLTELAVNNNNLCGSLENVFNPELQRSLGVVLVNDNAFRGTLPNALFSLPSLTSFVAGRNCFEGTLPESICSAQKLYSLAMDGLSSSPACRSPVLPSTIARSYVVHNRVSGKIPDCLYRMSSLNSLHLSGNGFTGTLPANLSTSPVLLYLSLSNNDLRGTIPRAFQEKQWKQLDLSYNRYGGTLLTTFATEPTTASHAAVVLEVYGYAQEVVDQIVSAIELNLTGTVIVEETLQNLLQPQRQGYQVNQSIIELGQSLHLKNNRLSGLVPATLMERTNISLFGSNIFACKSDKSNLPPGDRDTDTYSCGSTSFDLTYYVWLIATGIALTVVLIIWRYRHYVERYVGVEYVYKHVTLWLGVFSGVVKFPQHASQFKLDNLYAMNRLLNIFVNIMLCCMAFIVLVLCPMYLILSLFYSVYTHQYAWVVSAAFLSGYVPIICEIVLLLFVLLVMMMGITYIDKFVSTVPQTPIDQIMEEKVLSVLPSVQRWTKILVYTCFSILNFIVVMSVNTAFIYVSLNKSNAQLLFAQVWLALFKVLWNNTLITHLLWAVHVRIANCLNNGTEFSETRYVTIQVYTALLNNIVIPCIVVAIVSSSCYYNVFVQQVRVEAWFTREYCQLYDPNSEECILNQQQLEIAHYNPPFAYSYQCSFSLITNYAPAFVVMCFVVTFLIPAMVATGQQLLRRATPGTKWHAFLDRALPRILKLPTQESESDAARLTRLTRFNSLQYKSHEQYDNPYFDVNKLVINIITQLAIMLTFGAMFPPLAVALGFSIFATIYFEKLKVGRFLTAVFRAKLFTYVHIIELECQELGSVSQLLKKSVWLLMIVKCCFYTMVIFDTLGDKEGISHAYWVLFVVPLFPLVLYGAHRAIEARRPHTFTAESTATATSARGSSTASVGVIKRDTESDISGTAEHAPEPRRMGHVGSFGSLLSTGTGDIELQEPGSDTATVNVMHDAEF